jgi:hypothetical protein
MIYSLLTKNHPNYVFYETDRQPPTPVDVAWIFSQLMIASLVVFITLCVVVIFKDYQSRMVEINTHYCQNISTTGCK